jgi:WXG100 family type VII secretion target
MAVSKAQVDSDKIGRAVYEINTEIENLRRISDVLSKDVVSQLEPNWSGTAKDEFVSQFNPFADVFREYVKSCESLNAELDKAKKNYDSTDGKVRQSIASLPN